MTAASDTCGIANLVLTLLRPLLSFRRSLEQKAPTRGAPSNKFHKHDWYIPGRSLQRSQCVASAMKIRGDMMTASLFAVPHLGPQ